jgi:hypothetical protein
MKTTILAAVAAIALCSGAQADSSWRCGDARVSPPSHVTAYIRQVYDDLDMKRVAAGLPTSQVTYWKGTYDFVMRFCYASGDGANLDEPSSMPTRLRSG